MNEQKTNWPLIGLLWCVGLFAAAQFGKFSLTLDVVAQIYPSQGARVSIAVSTLSLMGVLFGVVVGAIVARNDVRRVLVAGLVLGGALSALQALGLPFWALLASRVVEGATHLCLVVSAPMLMGSLAVGRDKPVAMGLWATFVGVSFALIALMLPGLMALGGLRAVLLAHGAGMLILAAVVGWALPPQLPRAVQGPGWLRVHGRIYRHAHLCTPALGFVWYTLIFIALLAYLPGLMGLSPVATASLSLLGLVGTFSAGFLARRVAPGQILIVGFLCCALGWALFGLVPGLRPGLVYPLFALIGVLPGASFASVPHLNPVPADQALANGAIAQMGNVGTGLGTPLFALAVAGGGMGGLVWLCIGLCLGGLVSVGALYRAAQGQGA